MEYQAAVTEARTLVKRSEDDQWRLAQLTWEQMRQNGIAGHRWAKDIGVHFSTVYRWRDMWERFGQAEPLPKYQDAYSAIRLGSDVEPEEAASVRHHEVARSAVRNMPPEQKAEVVREALQDEQVAEQVVRNLDPAGRANLARAESRVEVERQRTARERYELAEPRSVQIGALADLEYALTKVRQAAEDASEAADTLAAHGWPDSSRERGAVLAQRAAASVELVRAKLEGRTLDEELAALLADGDA